MAFGINTTLSIIKWGALSLILLFLATIEYVILDATVFDLARQMQRYHDMNYNPDGSPKYPDEHKIGWSQF